MKAPLLDRIASWRDDDKQGYDTAIGLLCEAEEALRAYAAADESRRDEFAALAMHAEAVSAGSFEGPRDALVKAAEQADQTPVERIAFNAYQLADAMLEARKR